MTRSGAGTLGRENFVVAIVEFELFVVEIEVGEDAVLFHQVVGEDRAGRFDGEGFAQALLALDQEVHLGAEGGAGLFVVEIGEKWVVFAVVNAARVQAFGEHFGERGFADAERPLDHDEAGRLRAALRNRGAFGGRRFVGGHQWLSGEIIADSFVLRMSP